MLRPRIIPCLLIQKGGLVKTQGFKSPRYVGDPINAVKIFNEKESDELMILDIDATANGVEPNYALIAKLAAECRMPLSYGGGVTSADQAARIVDLGVEKVAVSAAAISNPELLTKMAYAIGRQSVGRSQKKRPFQQRLRVVLPQWTHDPQTRTNCFCSTIASCWCRRNSHQFDRSRW
jgi:cyclase